MLRRFEMYGFRAGTAPDQVTELARVLLRTSQFVPEVLYNAVGRNESEADVELIWEQAYEGPEAYARYMCHPYHICMLDRYLLPECPECITAARPQSQLGLLGYEIDGLTFRRERGIRRLVAMKVAPDIDEDAWRSFASALTDRPAHTPDLRVSIVAPNTMGLEWVPDGWTHLWEQAYDDEPAMRRALADERAVLEAGPLDSWVDVHYRLETEPAADAAVIHLIDTVDVRPDDLDPYLAAFEECYLPGATERGMELVGCWHTPTHIGEMVTVTVVFRMESWADWERIRNAGVRDPLMSTWVDKRRALMLGGSRRFYESASFSP